MTLDQIDAVRTAYLDLVGSVEARNAGNYNSHDWQGHLISIKDLEKAFTDILSDIIKPVQFH